MKGASVMPKSKSLSDLKPDFLYEFEEIKTELRKFQKQNHRRFEKKGLIKRHGSRCGCWSCEPFRRLEEGGACYSCPSYNSPFFEAWRNFYNRAVRDPLEDSDSEEPSEKKSRVEKK